MLNYLTDRRLHPSLSVLYGPQLTRQLSIVHAHLIIAIASTIYAIPTECGKEYVSITFVKDQLHNSAFIHYFHWTLLWNNCSRRYWNALSHGFTQRLKRFGLALKDTDQNFTVRRALPWPPNGTVLLHILEKGWHFQTAGLFDIEIFWSRRDFFCFLRLASYLESKEEEAPSELPIPPAASQTQIGNKSNRKKLTREWRKTLVIFILTTLNRNVHFSVEHTFDITNSWHDPKPSALAWSDCP